MRQYTSNETFIGRVQTPLSCTPYIIYWKRINLSPIQWSWKLPTTATTTTTTSEVGGECPLSASRHNRGESSWSDVKHVLMSTRFGHAAQKYLHRRTLDWLREITSMVRSPLFPRDEECTVLWRWRSFAIVSASVWQVRIWLFRNL